jgi:arylsulfatase A-like enzyme
MPSLFTGLYPSNLLRDYTHPRVRGAKPYVYYLQHDVPVLTELLAERGYHTHGYPMVSLLRSFGLDRGFRDYSRTRAVGREAQQLLAKEPAEPFFLWLHFHGPHRPYDKKKGYDYGDSLIDRYDSEIAYTDAQIGGVLEALRTAGLEQKTIVALTADHGEAFGERGTFFHGGKPHRELTHVPLIVRIPGRKPGVFDEPVELVDFVPTICELIGFSVPCTEFDGQSLLATAAGRRSAAYRGAYSENYDRYDGVQRRALFTGNWRLIQDRLTNSVELYDVRADPNEERDVAYLHPDIWKPLQEQIVARSLRRVANVFRRYDATRNPLELARGLSSIRDEALLGLALDRLAMAPARKPIAPHVQNLLSRPGLSPLVVQKADELLRKNQL